MVGVPTRQLNHYFLQLQLVLADRATLVCMLVSFVVQLLDFLLGESLRDFANFVTEVEELLSKGVATS